MSMYESEVLFHIIRGAVMFIERETGYSFHRINADLQRRMMQGDALPDAANDCYQHFARLERVKE